MVNEEKAAKFLRRMGKSWFVLYKYYETIDSNELDWMKCKTVKMRQGFYKKTRDYHLKWLHDIIFANEKSLQMNRLNVTGFDITTMACIIYDKLTGKE